MSHLQVQNPITYCLLNGKPHAITEQRYNEFDSMLVAKRRIDKEEYKHELAIQLQKGKTICLSTYCNAELTKHNHGYCDKCEDFNQLEYEVN